MKPSDALEVLVVDDEPLVVRSLSRLLSIDGHQVLQARNPEDALGYVDERSTIDMVLLDLNLEGSSAIDCLLEMRRRGLRAPIVTMSGYPLERGMWQGLPHAERPHMHLQKPVSRENLRSAVEQSRASRRPREE